VFAFDLDAPNGDSVRSDLIGLAVSTVCSVYLCGSVSALGRVVAGDILFKPNGNLDFKIARLAIICLDRDDHLPPAY